MEPRRPSLWMCVRDRPSHSHSHPLVKGNGLGLLTFYTALRYVGDVFFKTAVKSAGLPLNSAIGIIHVKTQPAFANNTQIGIKRKNGCGLLQVIRHTMHN